MSREEKPEEVAQPKALDVDDRDDGDGYSSDDHDARTSVDVRRYDHETLTKEEEAESLLTGNEKAAKGLRRSEKGQGRHGSRRSGRKKTGGGEEGELMYEMEEGGPRSSSAESSGHSSEVDLKTLGLTQAKQKKSKVKRICKLAALNVLIISAFLALLYGAYRASQTKPSVQGNVTNPGATEDHKDDARPKVAHTLSNGTHIFAPSTVLISLDGFRADFLNRGLTPNLNAFIRAGVSPKYMTPSFPSLTFPQHETLVTGLYPESHGITSNRFFDPTTQREFDRSMEPGWWTAEPIWETAELAGVRSAIHMWPGSEAHVGRLPPAYVDKFNANEALDRKVDRVLGWLDLPGPHDVDANVEEPRPQFIAMYVPNVDADGHLYGPNSTYIRSTLAEVDGMVGNLLKGIQDRNLSSILNVVILSDHGMATTSSKRLIQFEDLVDATKIEHIDGWPLYGLRPYDHSEAELQTLYNKLLAKSRLPQYKGTFEVYTRQTMPPEFHFTNNDRIAPLWLIPTTGWAIVTRAEFDVRLGLAQDLTYNPKGLHGYDPSHALMRAIFAARGPAFPHPKGSQIDVFQNIEVYNLVCDSLSIAPRPNNGTLRLPLEPIGLHDFEEAIETPEDPQDPPNASASEPADVPNLASPHPSSVETGLPPEVSNLAIRPGLSSPTQSAVSLPAPNYRPFVHADGASSPKAEAEALASAAPQRPAIHDKVDEDEKATQASHWWMWAKGKLESVKAWVVDVFGGHRGTKAADHDER